ncbi:NACHT domain-containing protein [Streptomyces sp. NPDC015127]|uniref:NACHT domain-containing protein n=1 Tax=Streptomyces sp. NPDC015127 TaxID=3364939 RepID=UPI0036FF6252
MSGPVREPDPPEVRLEAHAQDHARIYLAGRDLYITQPAAPADDEPPPPDEAAPAAGVLGAPLLLMCAGIALIVLALTDAPGPVSGGPRAVALIAGLGALALAGPSATRRLRARQRARLRTSPAARRRHERRLDRAAQILADTLRARFAHEEKLRMLAHPGPLAVRWTTDEALGDHWASIRGTDDDTPLDLRGDFASVADVHAAVPSGRLLVLGGPGAGKSVLALRFAHDRLLTAAPGDRVPVLLPLASWDPATQDLPSWAAGRLILDHPWLAARTATGSPLATELWREGRLLPVLDGFDEIRADARPEALRRLRGCLPPSDPCFLTSRTEEYESAVAATDAVLPATAAVRLEPLTVDDVSGHLRRTTRRRVSGDGTTTKWDAVLARLRERPGTAQTRALSAVLSTPLMVFLARTAYSETARDPAELLDPARFPTRAALEDHLLDALIPSVCDYPEETTRRLAFLARRLDALGTQDLAWWRLGAAAPWALRTGGVALGLATATFLMRHFFGGDGAGAGPGGLALWSAFALLSALVVVDVAWGARGYVPVPRRFHRPASPGRLLLGGLPVAGLALLAAWLLDAPLLVVPLVCAGALVLVLHPSVHVATADSPARLLRQDRRATLTSLGLAGLIGGGGRFLRAAALAVLPLAALATWQADAGRGRVGAAEWAVAAGGCAAAVAVCGMSLSASGAFAAARVWPWLTGQLPWDLLAFLDDAHRRGILRQSGAYYRFRHARLQERLMGRTEAPPDPRAPAPDPRAARATVLRAPATCPRAARVRHRVASMAGPLVTTVFLAGTVTVWTGVVHLPHPPGPRLTVPPACDLLDRTDLTRVLPEPEILGDCDRGPVCWWHNAQVIPVSPNVQVETVLFEPLAGVSPVQLAQRRFAAEATTHLYPPVYTRRPAELGDEAVSLVKRPPYGGTMTETVVRVDNVLLTVTYVGGEEGGGRETYATSAGTTEALARAALRRIGP